MTKSKSVRLALLAGIAGSVLMWMPAANATTIEIGWDQGGVPNTFANDGGSGVTGGGGSFGSPAFSVTASAAGVNSGLSPGDLLTSNTIDVSASNSGFIDIWVTEIGLTTTKSIGDFSSAFTLNTCSKCSVTMATYMDATDKAYGTGTPLGSATLSSLTTSTATQNDVSMASPFSVTELYQILVGTDLSPGGSANATIDLSVAFRGTQLTPLPAALPLFGSLIGGGFLFGKFRKRRKTKSHKLASAVA